MAMAWAPPLAIGLPRRQRLHFLVALAALVAVTIFLTFFYLARNSEYDHSFYAATTTPPLTSRLSSTELDFWVNFSAHLRSVKPACRPLKQKKAASLENWEPAINHGHTDLLRVSHSDEVALSVSHASFVARLPTFVRHLPFSNSTTGIVTTTSPERFGQVVTLIVLIRQSGSRLPVEVMLDSSQPWIDELCQTHLRKFGATCINLQTAFSGENIIPRKFKTYQWKSIAIIASTFQNVLFLDADSLPVRNPDPIIDPHIEPFASTGLITWPDFWSLTSSKHFYSIAGNIEPPPVSTRPSSESGIIGLDKARHADTLLLSAYYNYYGPDYFYLLLCQHGPGEGDKETLLHAALVLESLFFRGDYEDTYTTAEGYSPNGTGKDLRNRVISSTHTRYSTAVQRPKKGHYEVRTLPTVHGQVYGRDNKWKGLFMLQMDPIEDYSVMIYQINKAAISRDNATTIRPAASKADPRKVMFFHHNGVKLDFTTINNHKSKLLATDWSAPNPAAKGNAKGGGGKPRRLWGDPKWISDLTDDGRDVEGDMWKGVADVWCELEGKGRGWRRVCQKMREVWWEVYGQDPRQ